MSGFANLQLSGSTSEDVYVFYERGLLAAGMDYEILPPYLEAVYDPLDEDGYIHLQQEPGLGFRIYRDDIERNHLKGD